MKFTDWLRNYKTVSFEDVRTYDDQVYSIYDTVTCEYGFPIVSKNDKVMLRDLVSTLKRDDKRLSDLSLVCIGSFNRESGVVQPHSHYDVCTRLSDLFNNVQPVQDKE